LCTRRLKYATYTRFIHKMQMTRTHRLCQPCTFERVNRINCAPRRQRRRHRVIASPMLAVPRRAKVSDTDIKPVGRMAVSHGVMHSRDKRTIDAPAAHSHLCRAHAAATEQQHLCTMTRGCHTCSPSSVSLSPL
jgi:hypothetical protein